MAHVIFLWVVIFYKWLNSITKLRNNSSSPGMENAMLLPTTISNRRRSQ